MSGPPLLTRPPAQHVRPPAGRGRDGFWWLLPAGALPLLVVVVLVAVVGLSPRPVSPLAGAGDPYFPDYGAGGYDALSYLVDVTVDDTVLGGTTTVTARATQDLDDVHLDLGLPVTRVTVDGEEAEFETGDGNDLRVEAPRRLDRGQEFVVRVDYAGDPTEVRAEGQREGTSPWYRDGEEQGVAGEPESSAWWFPADDHPEDPALFEVRARVRDGLQAISVGELVSRDVAQEDGWDTWHWRANQPMATYLTFLMVGRYRIDEGRVSGRPYVYAVSERFTPVQQDDLLAELAETPEWVAELERDLGPYPFSELGGVVPPFRFWFAGLETQTRPVYDGRSLLDDDYADTLLVHELAHMWFGDNVTLSRWDDIFNNEGWASYMEWVVEERRGGPTPNERMLRSYDQLVDEDRFWAVPMDDPGAERVFATVYDRGPMALQALRNLIGDPAFTRLMRDWAQTPGARSVEDFRARTDEVTDVDLDPWYEAWFRGTTAPARIPEHGFGA
ncbi:M1 family metallopeptidase [Auraticoccus monumenti]|uniref:Aminopeptidase N n=1 Tax=Auraticoccus monumenti TaxID=675864 RepID=A0A1G7EDG9_9ACTN|nr:M1 family metallopeptidase [Auraticoccus monumenti]SDE61734.1 Peptidase family M1 [Auraticoccus monumenti]